jgi:hypothetical protein
MSVKSGKGSTSTLSLVIDKVRFKKYLQKNTLAFKGAGGGETQKTILMVPEFHPVFLFSRAPPLLLHKFSLPLPEQLL